MQTDRGTPTSYEAITEFLIQDEPDFQPRDEGLEDSSGSVDKSEERRGTLLRCVASVSRLVTADHSWLDERNEEADQLTQYTLLYLVRHGQGIHNEVRQIDQIRRPA